LVPRLSARSPSPAHLDDGSKTNSHSFLLRVYRVAADFKTARGGSGEVKILNWITLHDPDKRVPFHIITESATDRLLTGGDFDIESMRVARDSTLWFGEEFGPFLLHTDATGKVLEAPIPLPGVESPDNPIPTLGTPNLSRSNGFEALAISQDRRTLYPILEGPVTGDDPTRRRVYAFDIATRRYVERLPDYRVATADLLVSDATVLDGRQVVVLERDGLQGAAQAWVRHRPTPQGTRRNPGQASSARSAQPARPSEDLAARPSGRHRARGGLLDALRDHRERSPPRRRPPRHRQRHQLRLHRTQPCPTRATSSSCEYRGCTETSSAAQKPHPDATASGVQPSTESTAIATNTSAR
jgi:phytase-like protein